MNEMVFAFKGHALWLWWQIHSQMTNSARQQLLSTTDMSKEGEINSNTEQKERFILDTSEN